MSTFTLVKTLASALRRHDFWNQFVIWRRFYTSCACYCQTKPN